MPHVGSKLDLKMDVQNLGISSPKTWGTKSAHFRVVLRRHRDLSVDVFGTKRAAEKMVKI